MLNSGQCPLYVGAAGRKVVLPGRGTRALILNGRSLTFLELRGVLLFLQTPKAVNTQGLNILGRVTSF